MVLFALQSEEQQAQHHLLVHYRRRVLETSFTLLKSLFFTVIRKRMLIEGLLISEVIPVGLLRQRYAALAQVPSLPQLLKLIEHLWSILIPLFGVSIGAVSTYDLYSKAVIGGNIFSISGPSKASKSY